MSSDISFEKEHDVWQTVNQAFQRTEVYVDNKKMAGDSVAVRARSVWQDSVGYYFPKKTELVVLAKKQKGSWFEINNAYSKEIISKDVFTLAGNLGKAGGGQASCYIICPNVSSDEDLSRKCANIEVVSNTADLHCVHDRKTDTFYLAAFGNNVRFRIPGSGKKITLSGPSLYIVKKQHIIKKLP